MSPKPTAKVETIFTFIVSIFVCFFPFRTCQDTLLKPGAFWGAYNSMHNMPVAFKQRQCQRIYVSTARLRDNRPFHCRTAPYSLYTMSNPQINF